MIKKKKKMYFWLEKKFMNKRVKQYMYNIYIVRTYPTMYGHGKLIKMMYKQHKTKFILILLLNT